MRVRLAGCLWEILEDGHSPLLANALCRVVSQKVGVEVSTGLSGRYGLSELIKTGKLRDVLDLITVGFSFFLDKGYERKAYIWKEAVQEIFEEESVAYKLDAKCGVHFLYDAEFERSRGQVITALKAPRYVGVHAELSKAFDFVSQRPPDTKNAVKSAFEAIEILSKLMDPQIKRLGSNEVKRNLRRIIISDSSHDKISENATNQLLESFASWVNSVQTYRHGQVGEGAVKPPLQMALLILSGSAAWLRWMLSFDPERPN
jgi:hypothetical protein